MRAVLGSVRMPALRRRAMLSRPHSVHFIWDPSIRGTGPMRARSNGARSNTQHVQRRLLSRPAGSAVEWLLRAASRKARACRAARLTVGDDMSETISCRGHRRLCSRFKRAESRAPITPYGSFLGRPRDPRLRQSTHAGRPELVRLDGQRSVHEQDWSRGAKTFTSRTHLHDSRSSLERIELRGRAVPRCRSVVRFGSEAPLGQVHAPSSSNPRLAVGDLAPRQRRRLRWDGRDFGIMNVEASVPFAPIDGAEGLSITPTHFHRN